MQTLHGQRSTNHISSNSVCWNRPHPCTWSESLATRWKNKQWTRENPQKLRLGAKKKSNVTYLIISATRRMILTKHVFFIDSVLHLSPQWEVTQLISLTIYVGTTQLSTTKTGNMKIPVFFQIAIYIAGLKKKIATSVCFQYCAALVVTPKG